MSTLRKIADEKDARTCLSAVARSGETLKAWTKRHGIDGRSLHSWKRNLACRTASPSGTKPRLVELVPVARTSPPTRRYVIRVGAASVEMGGDFERRLRRGDAAAARGGTPRVLTLSPAVRVFVVNAPLGMRGSFDALAGAVRWLGLDPTDGHLYLFLNKRRRIAKVIWFRRLGVVRPREAPRDGQLPAPRLR